MVPTYLVPVDAVPLTANGKIDRNALPPVDAAIGSAADAYHPPRTLVETALADMMSRLLGREQVSADAGFFDQGGNSLQAMQLVTLLREELGVDAEVTDVFLAPSCRSLGIVLCEKYGVQDVELDEGALEGLSAGETEQLLSDLE
jgi:acyl carrier protein